MPAPQCLHVAILAYNALAFTARCLDSVAAHAGPDHDIVILDNGSDDGTREWLASVSLRNLRVMHSDRNLGVAGGRNVLLAAILERAYGDDLIIFLDNDVEVSPGWFDPFVALFAQNGCAGIAGVTGHEIIVSADRRTLLPRPEIGIAEVDVVSGYCLCIPAHAASALGPFDEKLGSFWHEDDDYCVRAIALGYQVFCIPEAGMTHHGHKSGFATADAEAEASLINQRYLAGKWRELGLIDATGRIVRPTAPVVQ
jgi:GT2 family glycosyltransferase